MICIKCKDRETRNPSGTICEACRTRDWRKRNPKRVKDYAKMRQVRDSEKIKERNVKSQNDYMFGGNRIKVLERDNYTCQTCGITSESTRIVVHHKDRTGWGKKKKDKNNDMDNLISLCVPCHLAVHYHHRFPNKSSQNVQNANEEKSHD